MLIIRSCTLVTCSLLLLVTTQSLVKDHAIWTQHALIDELENYDPTPEWITTLRDPDAEVRGLAARALGNRRVKTAATELASALRDPGAVVRMQAAA